MDATDRTVLMHLVLDGEATEAQKRELDALLKADPAAQAEYRQLADLFRRLEELPPVRAPADLQANVIAALQARQLSAGPRVIESSARDRPAWIDNLLRAFRPEPTLDGAPMKKMLIGGAVAALAVVGVAQFGFGGKTSDKDTMGTVVPAERYRAPQATAADMNVQPAAGTAAVNPAAAAAADPAKGGDKAAPGAVADKAVADKAVADKAVADKAVADKAVADKAVADKAVQATAADAKAHGTAADAKVQGTAADAKAQGMAADAKAFGSAADKSAAQQKVQSSAADLAARSNAANVAAQSTGANATAQSTAANATAQSTANATAQSAAQAAAKQAANATANNAAQSAAK